MGHSQNGSVLGATGDDYFCPLPLFPFPVIVTTCGLLVASSVSVMVPDWGPAPSGLKVTLIVQAACASSALPQLLV